MADKANDTDNLKLEVTVVGAGVLGLWQALTCARAGYRVRLIDKNALAPDGNASSLAAGMLAPDCEAEVSPDLVRDLGRDGVSAWRASYGGVIGNGSLVVAGARDLGELSRFGDKTCGFSRLSGERVSELEGDLAGRFSSGLLFDQEAHFVTPHALAFLFDELRRLKVEMRLGETFRAGEFDGSAGGGVIIDCRGLAARDDPFAGTQEVLSRLRGVRGERIIISTDEVRLSRPVRLLHPRYPIYVVPWDNGRFVVGATLIESEDQSGVSARSVLELLGSAVALHPAFGEAEVVDIAAGVRPAFPDNVPRVVVARGGRVICVNGAYRHGYLLAPVLGQVVCDFLRAGRADHPLVVTCNEAGVAGTGAR